MPCFWCTVNKTRPTNPPCKLCVQETRSCSVDELVHDDAPCAPEDCKLTQHGCRFVPNVSCHNRRGEHEEIPGKRPCNRHRDLPLDAEKDHYVCSQHLAEQLELEERYPSVVMYKCAAPGCWDRCLPVPGENGVRYCMGHALGRKAQRPTSWGRPRPQVIQALREAGLHGLPWNVMTAREYPAVAACYKSDNGAFPWSVVRSDTCAGGLELTHACASQGCCRPASACC